jgi:hypothetical protein
MEEIMNCKNRFFQISIVLIFVVFSVSSAFAQVVTEVQVTEIKSEPENNIIHQLKLGLNSQGDIETIIRSSSVSIDEWDIQELIDGPIVLASKSGKDAVILSCTDTCNKYTGGNLTVSYLYDGIGDTYRKKYFYLTRTPSDDWELYTDTDQLVVNMTLVSRKLFGLVIGIKRIDVNAY